MANGSGFYRLSLHQHNCQTINECLWSDFIYALRVHLTFMTSLTLPFHRKLFTYVVRNRENTSTALCSHTSCFKLQFSLIEIVCVLAYINLCVVKTNQIHIFLFMIEMQTSICWVITATRMQWIWRVRFRMHFEQLCIISKAFIWYLGYILECNVCSWKITPRGTCLSFPYKSC